jgi:hypothetical protein
MFLVISFFVRAAPNIFIPVGGESFDRRSLFCVAAEFNAALVNLIV